MDNLKILSLKAENIKKLVAISITPDGNTVLLTGANGEGKTSALDCISWALEGKAKIQNCPIRFGENKAWIEIDLGKYLVHRDFKLKKDGNGYDTTITVTSKDGAEFSSPQALLDTVFGSLAFDPLAFSRAAMKDQVAALEGLVKDFDFAKSRAEEKMAYDERTIVNRKVKDASQTHISFKDVPVPEPEKVDVKALTDKMALEASKNTERQKKISEKESLIKTIESEIKDTADRLAKEKASRLQNQDECISLEKRIQALKELDKISEKTIQVYENKVVEIEHILGKAKTTEIPDAVDLSLITADLDAAQTKNALHETWTKKNEAKIQIDTFQAQSDALTTKIENIQKERRAAVAAANIPVEGLEFDEVGGVTLNKVPFEQCSSGEKLKTSVILAMLSNPTLRVIRVADGSLLDEKGLALLADLARSKDYQIWVEKTDESGKIGIVFEEGKVLTVNP